MLYGSPDQDTNNKPQIESYLQTRKLSRRRLAAVVLAVILGTAILVTVQRVLEQRRFESEIDSVAGVIAPTVWNYFTQATDVALSQFGRQRRYQELTVTEPDGTLLGEYRRRVPFSRGWVGRVLSPQVSYSQTIIYQETVIGEVKAIYRTLSVLFGLAAAVMVSGLATAIAAYVRYRGMQLRLSLTVKELDIANYQSSLSRVIIRLSHEVNTPVGNLKTLLSYLTSHSEALGGDQGAVQEMATIALAQVDRLRALMTRIRRLDPVVIEELPVRVALDDLIESTVQKIRLDASVRGSGATYVTAVGGGSSVVTYATILADIVSELCDNAVRHGGRDDETIVTVGVTSSPRGAEITVRDNGTGIDPSIQPVLFEPFSVPVSGTSVPTMGLHTVYMLTNQVLGGEISFTSDSDGTTFSVRLPRRVQPSS